MFHREWDTGDSVTRTSFLFFVSLCLWYFFVGVDLFVRVGWSLTDGTRKESSSPTVTGDSRPS